MSMAVAKCPTANKYATLKRHNVFWDLGYCGRKSCTLEVPPPRADLAPMLRYRPPPVKFLVACSLSLGIPATASAQAPSARVSHDEALQPALKQDPPLRATEDELR